MSITPPSPIPRSAIARWELDGFSARVGARTVVLVFIGYDVQDKPVATRRFDVTDDTAITFANLNAACPAGGTFKRQIEEFAPTLAAELSGNVT
jgi:hypothetical protein